jgi:hypothetical protein
VDGSDEGALLTIHPPRETINDPFGVRDEWGLKLFLNRYLGRAPSLRLGRRRRYLGQTASVDYTPALLLEERRI